MFHEILQIGVSALNQGQDDSIPFLKTWEIFWKFCGLLKISDSYSAVPPYINFW